MLKSVKEVESGACVSFSLLYSGLFYKIIILLSLHDKDYIKTVACTSKVPALSTGAHSHTGHRRLQEVFTGGKYK